MANKEEIIGLDADLDTETRPFSGQILMDIINRMGIDISKYVVSIICEYSVPGIVYIHTRDGKEFAVSRRAIALSTLLSTQAELQPDDPIHLTRGTGHTINRVVQFLEHHAGVEPVEIAKPIRSVNMFKIVGDEWDAKFAISLSKRETFQLIVTANYIDCPSLLHLLCASIATMIKGKSPEEINIILSEDAKKCGEDAKKDDEGAKKCDEVDEELSRSVCICGHIYDDPQGHVEAKSAFRTNKRKRGSPASRRIKARR